jgi:polyisoprenyl-phosphate glycosyltransferase
MRAVSPPRTLSVVVPLHDEEAALDELLRRLTAVLAGLEVDWEIVLVDDGSVDRTWSLVVRAGQADERVRGVRLSRNFGHQIALSAGLEAASGDAVVTMDGDLQHPPELLPRLLEEAATGYDVVYAVRSEDDSEGWFKVHTAEAFYWLLNRMTRLNLPHGGADYRYMSRQVVDAVVSMPERNRFLRGMTRWTGFAQGVVEYDRADRLGGRSKYSLSRMMSLAWDAIVSFSALPLRLVSMLGFLVSFAGALYLLYVIAVRITSHATVSGWTSMLAVTLILGGVQLVSLGIIGQYLGRMYDEVKGRPLFLVREFANLDDGLYRPRRTPEIARDHD